MAAALAAAALALPAAAAAQASAHAAPVGASSAAAAIEELRARGLEVPVRGIAPDELALLADAGARSVRLGDEVLRTSTAGVVAVAALLSRTRRWS